MYHLGLLLYWLTALFIAPFNSKAAKFVKGRRAVFGRLKRDIPAACSPVWFHCASLGEFEQGRPLIEAYRKAHANEKILLTFFSPSGYEASKNYKNADWVCYLPLDTYCNARRFLNIVRPSKAVFVKYEFWFNYLRLLRKRRIPAYVVSAIFRKSQPFFHEYGFAFRYMLRCFTRIFVQNRESLELLQSIGVESVEVSGDTRFDRVTDLQANRPVPPALCRYFADGDAVYLVAGSTWPADEQQLCAVLDDFPRLRLVIAPHEVHEEHIRQITDLFAAYRPVCYSQCRENIPPVRVLVIDCIGILNALYRYAHLCYIGGGFNRSGIHNCLEAATYGKALVFGPQYGKFREAKDLIAIGSAKSYRDTAQLRSLLHRWLDPASSAALAAAGEKAAAYVRQNTGATAAILAKI